jgi:hypothetical protein
MIRPHITEKKAKNAIYSYAYEAHPSEILVLIDDTIFGSSKTGALLTAKTLYTDTHVVTKREFSLKLIQSIFVDGCKVYINCDIFGTWTNPGNTRLKLFVDIISALIDRYN